ncbi:hypothetical protein AYJ57_21475 (plasmid) [Salipiger sp. CCB-MM3]|uniref:hypothetical protein n=1 Tax=Salipiger sp. CCB-MM3 TaxID=1792508 RepID=UPI00080AB673|nr:hypothetical protein [Salipiger sp. CCB-MM3]ANT63047.1 hypothetical protein AYJ57_21475 [Salipiger sp. CCB-MM3]
MGTATEFTKAFSSLPNVYDSDAFKGAFASFSDFQGKFSEIAIASASMSTDVLLKGTKDALENVRTLTKARDRSNYAQAFLDFMQAQAKVAQDTAASLSEIMKGSGTEVSELATEAAQETTEVMTEVIEASVEVTEEAQDVVEKAEPEGDHKVKSTPV